MTYRVAAAEISHETNVFSVMPTDIAAFQSAGLLQGPSILRRATGTNSPFGGLIAGAGDQGFALIPLVSVWATPSGMVTTSAIQGLADILAAGLREALHAGPLDGVLLALHGAMVTEIDDDGDALLLELTRQIVGPTVPIIAITDLHANLSDRMVDAATVLIGYDTYPHVDMAERGREACEILARVIRGDVHPTTALRKPPMLPTSQNMTTDRDPMRTLIARAHEMERDPSVINVTVAGGFPPADVADAGFGVLVTTNNDSGLADRLANDLISLAWNRRDGFLGGVSSFADAAAALKAKPRDKPIVLVDIGDNPWTGGPGDSAELLRFFLAERVTNAAIASVCDPGTVRACIESGVGSTLDVRLGGKTDDLHGPPLEVRGRVHLISDGRYVNAGPMMAGVPVDLGPTVVLTVGSSTGDTGIDVFVTSRAETPIDLNVFRAHGIEPTTRHVIGLKGKGHFRAAFEPIASRVVLVEGPGITGADLTRLLFRHIRRPIWPLDAVDSPL